MSVKLPEIDEFDAPLDHSHTDVKYITKCIIDILKYMKTPEIVELYKNDTIAYTKKIEENFSEFAENYPCIFMQVIQNNVEIIFEMLNRISDIQNGQKTQQVAEKELGNILQSKYMKKSE